MAVSARCRSNGSGRSAWRCRRRSGNQVRRVAGAEGRRLVHGGLATDESAEADTLVVRCEFDDRELLLEDAPDTYYVTDFYAKYPLVLVRLAEVTEDALRDLLSVSRKMALEKSRRR